MKKHLLRKKQSKRIAKLAFKKGVIHPEIYQGLYIDTHFLPNRKKLRMVEELFHGSWSYYGEWDDTPLIDMVETILYFGVNKFDNDLRMIEPIQGFNTPRKIIDYLNTLKNCTYPNPVLEAA